MNETIQQKTKRLIGGHYLAAAGSERWRHNVARELNEVLLIIQQGKVTPEQAGVLCRLCERVAEFEDIRFFADDGKGIQP
ncbi:MAG TPA: hypothetical protein VHG89_04745 [Verrucomicrobiae bacterium]|nr:hypothetical protein [Verrucomicrobiae bacterium]